MPFGDLLDRNADIHFHVGNAGNIGEPDREGSVETLVDLVEEPVGRVYVDRLIQGKVKREK